jgi:predicted phosphodiesterase
MAGIIDLVKEHVYGLFDIPYVPEEILTAARPLVLHISDTPATSYRFIFRLIQRIEPDYLIHTGDFVDDIKLENRPGQLVEYRGKLKKIFRQLEDLPVGKIYLVPGNHDDRATVDECIQRAVVLPEKSVIEIDNIRLCVSHYYPEAKTQIKEEVDYMLFGHNLMPDQQRGTTAVLLNGITAIHVLSTSSKRVYSLAYPSGTDSARKVLLPKVGL